MSGEQATGDPYNTPENMIFQVTLLVLGLFVTHLLAGVGTSAGYPRDDSVPCGLPARSGGDRTAPAHADCRCDLGSFLE